MYQFNEITNKDIVLPQGYLGAGFVHFTQSFLYGELQKGMGRKVRRFEIKKTGDDGDSSVGFFQVIKYKMPLGKSYLSIPHGPVVENDLDKDENFLKELNNKLVEITKEERSIFLRNELTGKKTLFYTYHSSAFQPKYEWRVNLKKEEETLLKEMHQKTRYNVRLSDRKGVQVEILPVPRSSSEVCNDFYEIMKKTSKRDGFYLHTKDYYQKLFLAFSENSFFAIAKYDGKILAMNFILLSDDTAYFLFGGSSNEHRNLMPSYLIQWESMREARRRGSEWYNFGGISKDGYIYKGWENLTIFKKKFGGEMKEYPDFYDIVNQSFWYWLYCLRKRLKK